MDFRKSADALYRLAAGLQGLGYDVSLRTALGGGTTECFKSLRHEFLVVRGTGEFHGMEFIVEPSLRQHFLIPHPSREYDYVLSRTPDVFVGGSCRLVSVVQLLCALMADSFTRQGLPLPPWRREAAMLSKWLPHPSRILDLNPCNTSVVAADPSTCSSAATASSPTAAATAAGGLTTLSVLSWVPTAPRSDAADPAFSRCRESAVVVGFDVSNNGAAAEEMVVDHQQGRYGGPSLSIGKGGSRRCRRSSSCSGGVGVAVGKVQLPYPVGCADTEEDLDLEECASPCRGHSAADDTCSFLLGSDSASASSSDSPPHLCAAPSLLGSPAGAAAPPPGFFSRAASLSSVSSSRGRAGGGRRATGTGMLPCVCPCLGTGLLTARLVLEPLAAGMAATLPPPPPRQAAAVLLPLPVASSPSHFPSAVTARLCPFTPAADAGPAPRCVETRPPVHPDAPAIHLVRLAGARTGCSRSGYGGGGGAQGATAAPELSEWLPWGLPH